MKNFFKKYGLAIVAAVLGGVVIYDHFSEITSAAKNAGKWIGDKCGSNNEDVPEEKEPEPEPEPEKPQNRFERRPYTGNMGNNGKYNNKK